MPGSKDKQPTYEEVLAVLLRSVNGPIPLEELAEKVLAVRPSQAKNPLQAARQQIRQANGRLLVFQDTDTVLPLRLAFQGVRFRLPLDRETVNKGLLDIEDSLSSYLSLNFPLEQVQFVDTAGTPIPFRVKQVSQQIHSPFGPGNLTLLHANLSAWFRAQKVYHKDHLLFTILDWEKGIFRLEREPGRQRDENLLASRNRLLADAFFDLLECSVEEDVLVRVAVPTIYSRLPDKGGYPPLHWAILIMADERMTTDGWCIRYRDDGLSPLERLTLELSGEPRHAPSRPVSKEQGGQVYRFKAALAYRPKLWRVVEVQGKHSLVDLDGVLRTAFNHDLWDHLGGFWKLVPRGPQEKPVIPKRKTVRQTRYREVELGDVEPMGGGEGAKIKIAGVGLAVGDRLKYVYDFGDWIEHLLTLEAIEAPQAGVEYPHEVARNQPDYAYCVECNEEGKQAIAKWICLECSTDPGDEVVLCDKCANEHEEHYLEEILY